MAACAWTFGRTERLGATMRLRQLSAWYAALGVLLALSFPLPGIASAESDNRDPTAPRRVISMNLCTDQLAMMIAAPGQLYSVSNLASDPSMSMMAKQARAYKPNHGLAEEVFLMRPDLILVGAMTTRTTVAMLERLGFPVVEFPFENSFSDMRANIKRMGDALHRPERARELLARFDADLAQLRKRPGPRRTAALFHANSYTSGVGTLANEVLKAAGLDNIAVQFGLSGTAKLPLEKLVMAAPDLVVTDTTWEGAPALAQQVFAHPALRALEATSAKAMSATNRWICATPHLIDLIRDLSAARAAVTTIHDRSATRQ